MVLDDNADRFKDGLVLLDVVAKSSVKDRKVFNSSVESLLARSGTALELSQFFRVLTVWDTKDFLLSTVPIVTNAHLAHGNLIHESILLAEDCNVGL